MVAGCSMLELAKEYGTPLFVYDEGHIRNRCRQAVGAFPDGAAYASKAFLCLSIARLVSEEGMQIDVATGGEMFVSLSSGVTPENLVLHGNNKSMDELRLAMKAGVSRIVVDSFDELDRVEELSAELSLVQNVVIRITPGVSAHTHEFISTGQDDTKFGFTVSSGMAKQAIKRAENSSAMNLMGIHSHIGSQILNLENLGLAAEKITDFAQDYDFQEISFGGGLGVAYVENDVAPSISEWAEVIHDTCKKAGIKARICAEPGRAIVANSALTLYTVGTIKELDGLRTYVSIDGGMSDNLRPALYESEYELFLPRAADAERNREVTLVGKHCETGDILIRNGNINEDISVGDIVGVPVTGAYGFSLSSNYNKVPRPAAIFVQDGGARTVIRRETYEDLLKNDMGVRDIKDPAWFE